MTKTNETYYASNGFTYPVYNIGGKKVPVCELTGLNSAKFLVTEYDTYDEITGKPGQAVNTKELTKENIDYYYPVGL